MGRRRVDRYVDYLPLDEIQAAPRNPKGHDGAGINRSINHHGLAELPLIDERIGRLVAGHGRHEQLTAMRDAGNDAPDGVKVDDDGTWHMPVVLENYPDRSPMLTAEEKALMKEYA